MFRNNHDWELTMLVSIRRWLRKGEHLPEYRRVPDKRSSVDSKLHVVSHNNEVTVVEPELVISFRRP